MSEQDEAVACAECGFRDDWKIVSAAGFTVCGERDACRERSAYARGRADAQAEHEQQVREAVLRDGVVRAARRHSCDPHVVLRGGRCAICLALSRYDRARSTSQATQQPAGPWLTIIAREGVPEVIPFASEADAVAHFDQASIQWSESYLARAVRWPRDGWAVSALQPAAREIDKDHDIKHEFDLPADWRQPQPAATEGE